MKIFRKLLIIVALSIQMFIDGLVFVSLVLMNTNPFTTIDRDTIFYRSLWLVLCLVISTLFVITDNNHQPTSKTTHGN
jgi:hypothetical protein